MGNAKVDWLKGVVRDIVVEVTPDGVIFARGQLVRFEADNPGRPKKVEFEFKAEEGANPGALRVSPDVVVTLRERSGRLLWRSPFRVDWFTEGGGELAPDGVMVCIRGHVLEPLSDPLFAATVAMRGVGLSAASAAASFERLAAVAKEMEKNDD